MAQPKQQTTRRRTGNRRSHLFAKLQRAVNRTSPVKVVSAKKAAAQVRKPVSSKRAAVKNRPVADKKAPAASVKKAPPRKKN